MFFIHKLYKEKIPILAGIPPFDTFSLIIGRLLSIFWWKFYEPNPTEINIKLLVQASTWNIIIKQCNKRLPLLEYFKEGIRNFYSSEKTNCCQQLFLKKSCFGRWEGMYWFGDISENWVETKNGSVFVCSTAKSGAAMKRSGVNTELFRELSSQHSVVAV